MSREITNHYVTISNQFPSKMIVHRNVFAIIILHRIGIYVGGTELVIIERKRCRKRETKIIQKLVNLYSLNNCITNSSIFSLSVILGNSRYGSK